MKIRLYELAKQMGYSTGDFISKASRAGLVLKNRNPVTMMDEELARLIANAISGGKFVIKFPEVKPTKKELAEQAKKAAAEAAAAAAAAAAKPPVRAPEPPRPMAPHHKKFPVHTAAVHSKPSTEKKPQPAEPPALFIPAKTAKIAGEKTESPLTSVVMTEESSSTDIHGRIIRPSEVAYYSNAEETIIRERRGKVVKYQKDKNPAVKDDNKQPVAPAENKKHDPKHAAPAFQQRRMAVIPKPQERPVQIPREEKKFAIIPPIALKDFSHLTGLKINQLMKKLIDNNIMLTINDFLTEEVIVLMGLEFNLQIEIKKATESEETVLAEEPDKPEDLVSRPPIVVIMGHVDHGKTTLLDKIRSANIAEKEAGGITQHIGAYQAEVKGKLITFLDTPGHEAFTAMRARGANVTDIAVLVVAADDGVMPQTEEAISHAKEAKVTMMAALNKMDKKEANPNRVKQQLSQLGLIPDEWGGNTIYAEVSAMAGTGIDTLLDMLLLQAEVLELKANPNKKARGVVLEAKIHEGKGIAPTFLVQSGTLKKGDIILCGRSYGKVRAMFTSAGKEVHLAKPSTPVEVLGLSAVPEAGDKFFCLDSIQQAKEIAEKRERVMHSKQLAIRQHITLTNLFEHIKSGNIKEVRVVVKTDVKGSAEVISESLKNLSTGEVKVKIIHFGVGNINESDILLADVTDSIIVGFHTFIDERAKTLVQEKGVEVHIYQVIYQLMDDIKKAMEGQLEPERVEETTGHLHVKEVYNISRIGTIAGCIVSDGKVERANMVRLFRNKTLLHQGRLASLKRFKDDVHDVAEGYECGIRIEGFNDIASGDIIESYRIKEIARKLGV